MLEHSLSMMELTKSLKDDIVKIQNELITAIQNHQVLVLRQQVCPSDSTKTQIEEVQRHIICLGESQKILVARLRNELESQPFRVNSKPKPPIVQRQLLKPLGHVQGQGVGEDCRQRDQELSHCLLRTTTSNSNHLLPKERQLSPDSSSEENRTPCQSPVHDDHVRSDVHIVESEECARRGLKRSLTDIPRSPSKRTKTTLQATPRPSSPAAALPTTLDGLSGSSEESLDSLISQNPESENKIEFALSLGLITKDVFNKIIKKKSQRKRRRVNSQHHLYNDLWDLTTVQKRSRLKDTGRFAENCDDASPGCLTPCSDSDNLCFICQQPGELKDCRVCQTGCHTTCIINHICPACTHPHPVSDLPLVHEKKKELEQLRLNNKELHKSVSELREKANRLSDSLVKQTAHMNQIAAKDEKAHKSINRLSEFISWLKDTPTPCPKQLDENEQSKTLNC